MKGIYKITVTNSKVKYEFSIKRNITIIRGDSATGKTTLVEMINEYYESGEQSGITLNCDKVGYYVINFSDLYKKYYTFGFKIQHGDFNSIQFKGYDGDKIISLKGERFEWGSVKGDFKLSDFYNSKEGIFNASHECKNDKNDNENGQSFVKYNFLLFFGIIGFLVF